MEICSLSGLRPTEICRAAGTVISDYFIERHAPRSTCDIHSALFPDFEDPIDGGDETEIPEEPGEEDPGEVEPPPDDGDDRPPGGDPDLNRPLMTIPIRKCRPVAEEILITKKADPLRWWENFTNN
jgi:hypothetical protein